MEKFIESFEKKPTSQKILITLGVAAVMLLIIALLYFLTGTSGSDSKNTKELSEKSSQSLESPEVNPTHFIPESRPIENWHTYLGSNYQISYPSSLEGTPGVIEGKVGGTYFNMHGEDESTEFDIAFSVRKSDESSSLNINQKYKDLGYKQKQIIVGNRSASKFSGETVNIHENIVQFEDSGKLYKLRLSYISSTSNPRFEELFDEILSTIIIN